MFMMPSHNVITPASGSAMSITPILAESKVPSMMLLEDLGVAKKDPLRQRGDEADQEEAGPDVIQCHVV